MRVTLRALPLCHKWLLFGLLERDYHRLFRGVDTREKFEELQQYYESLCPENIQRPFAEVLQQLTEAFVRESSDPYGDIAIEWIDPSCRDLAISELSGSLEHRRHFVSHCTLKGVQLATSIGGGALGQLNFPFVKNEADWNALATRCKELTRGGANTLGVLWTNYR